MYHLKYYVIFMTGIFLAMGIGIMIGITLENKDILDNQQSLLVKQIEESFISIKDKSERLREENKSIVMELNEYKNISGLLFSETARNKLAGLKIAVVGFNDKGNKEVIELLKLAGAAVNADIVINCKSKDSIAPDQLETFAGKAGGNTSRELINELVYAISEGETASLVQELQGSSIFKISANMGGEPSDAVLIMPDTTLKSSKNRYDILFIEAAVEAQLPIVAVEAASCKETFIPDYIKYGISSVDHIDTIYGKLSLLSLLTGNAGNYGVGKNAKSLMPDPLFLDYMESAEN